MRLSSATLARLPADVARPRYDRAAVATGIVHLGLGAFFRAQGAVFTEAVLAGGDARWGILGASLRSPDTRDALRPQDHLYTVAERGPQQERLQVIGALTGVMVGAEDLPALIDAMAQPRVAIVSLTVTEKGYCYDPASGDLDESHADIVHDLAHPEAPRSAPALLVSAIARRRMQGVPPLTVLCCDNLPHNGATLRRIVSQFAALRDRDLARFIEDAVAFPSTMLDRIVPATTPADRASIAARLGMEDASPVVTEPYNQWVIEDRFAGVRPAWDDHGATLVRDIAPYETMKLRLLNASHSLMAYLGYLAGHETIADTIADPSFRRLVDGFMDAEVTPTLRLPASIDVAAYKRALLERFANPALRHRTAQIAMDGSQKLPQRLLDTARERLRIGAPIPRLALAVAGWMRYVTGTDENGGAIEVRDPLAPRLRRIADAAGPSAERLAPALLSVREVFGADLPSHPAFAEAVTAALDRLFAVGARQTVAEIAAASPR